MASIITRCENSFFLSVLLFPWTVDTNCEWDDDDFKKCPPSKFRWFLAVDFRCLSSRPTTNDADVDDDFAICRRLLLLAFIFYSFFVRFWLSVISRYHCKVLIRWIFTAIYNGCWCCCCCWWWLLYISAVVYSIFLDILLWWFIPFPFCVSLLRWLSSSLSLVNVIWLAALTAAGGGGGGYGGRAAADAKSAENFCSNNSRTELFVKWQIWH